VSLPQNATKLLHLHLCKTIVTQIMKKNWILWTGIFRAA